MMQMAPDSNFNYPIELNGDKLKPGDYVVKVEAKSKDKIWNFDKELIVTKEKAKKLNSQDVSIKKNNRLIYYLIGIICLVTATIVLFSYNKRLNSKKIEISKLKKQLEEKDLNK